MGGDQAPRAEVEGAIRAAKSLGVQVVLVGREETVKRELNQHDGARALPIEVVNATQQVTMAEGAARAVRGKRDSSIRVACRLVREGAAQGVVSAGNTGATMVTAKMVQGMLPGVDRPALASAFPTITGTPAVMVDVGANVDCTARMLAQFGVMGDVYSRLIFHTRNPRVSLLSIGEEEHKGNDLTRAAAPLLKGLPLNFIGKSEGLVDVIKHMLHESLEATITRKIGYVLSRAAFADFKKRVDYSEYGGAPLLGVKGVCIICHGRSNANAIKNAIRVAADLSRGQSNWQIESEAAKAE
jgi:glycerol-3-phosphate acyltransferase PlsX